MSSDPKEVWFPAKRYGYGWGPPNCWQGWVVTGAFVAAISIGAILIKPARHPGFFVGWCLLLVAILTFVCYLKGEKPGWRWGEE